VENSVQVSSGNEAVLRARAARQAAVLRAAPIGIAITAGDGRLVEANPAYLELTGYTLDELQAIPFSAYTHPDDLAYNLREFERLIAGEVDRYSLQKRYIRKDGTIIWVRVTGALITDEDGNRYVVGMVDDITALREREQALAETNERLEVALNELRNVNQELWERLRPVRPDRPRVLLITEPTSGPAKVLAAQIAAAGYDRDVARTAGEAFVHLDHRRVDCLILNLPLRTIEPIEFVQQVRARSPRTLIVVLAPHDLAPDVAATADHLIEKPGGMAAVQTVLAGL
jgi:PAS domain S-box-containing protein